MTLWYMVYMLFYLLVQEDPQSGLRVRIGNTKIKNDDGQKTKKNRLDTKGVVLKKVCCFYLDF